jgi:septum formation protein
MQEKRLVLASGSPRRKELLAGLGLCFEVITSDVDESIAPGTDPAEAVQELAYRKALSVANTLSGGLVLGADTVVALDGQILGKPADAQEAKRMLAMLSGRTHNVYTGIALIEAGTNRAVRDVKETQVVMKELTPEEIDAYVATGEPLDKAGAYGIQGLASTFITDIHGDYFAVVGLPLHLTARHLAAFGLDVLSRRTRR